MSREEFNNGTLEDFIKENNMGGIVFLSESFNPWTPESLYRTNSSNVRVLLSNGSSYLSLPCQLYRVNPSRVGFQIEDIYGEQLIDFYNN